MCLNHPKTIPTPPPRSMEKFSSMKPVPGAKEVGDHSSKWFLVTFTACICSQVQGEEQL